MNILRLKRVFGESIGDNILMTSFYSFVIIFSVLCIIPFWLVISSSFANETTLVRYGYTLWPRQWSLAAYRLIFSTDRILNAYQVTIFITIVGTTLAMLVTSAMSYALSVKTFKFRNRIAFFVYFTMLFSGGLVPFFLLIRQILHLHDSIWVFIWPSLVNPWNMLLLRNFFGTLPASLSESAKIDGANDIYILFKIILPISLPGIATIGLFYALAFWNEWFRAVLFIDREALQPLQFLIMQITRNMQFAQEVAVDAGIPPVQLPSHGARMATATLAIGPVILFYPFVQKYFVKGLTVGGVKG